MVSVGVTMCEKQHLWWSEGTSCRGRPLGLLVVSVLLVGWYANHERFYVPARSNSVSNSVSDVVHHRVTIQKTTTRIVVWMWMMKESWLVPVRVDGLVGAMDGVPGMPRGIVVGEVERGVVGCVDGVQATSLLSMSPMQQQQTNRMDEGGRGEWCDRMFVGGEEE